MADTQDLGSCIVRCVGSSPTSRTIFNIEQVDKRKNEFIGVIANDPGDP